MPRHRAGPFIYDLTMSIRCIDEDQEAKPAIQAFGNFVRRAGVSPITGWRWRRNGWIETLNIAGRVYVTDVAIERFRRRAVAGEFSRPHPVPSRRKVAG